MADRPIVLITGAAGSIGAALAEVLADDYTVVGLDMACAGCPVECHEFDLTSDDSVELALRKVRDAHGDRIASVVHLAAYFDFTGEDSPLYDRVNVAGTRRLLEQLQAFRVEQFVYSGTMLVHRPCVPGERIDESAPIAPKWAYPRSKAAAERAILESRGAIPAVRLHIAGLYDDRTAVPTLTHQIARIYERALKGHVYAGDLRAGQAGVHREDLLDAFRRVVERRSELDGDEVFLIGEPDAMSYQRLQDRLAELIHGDADWSTWSVPKPAARAAAWLETVSEPVIPDAVDRGEKPFIRPFMIDMAEDHYALDVSRARRRLGWSPRHRLERTLPRIVRALKRDPLAWYEENGITPPDWLVKADGATDNAEALRAGHEALRRERLRDHLWAPLMNMALATWLVTSPPILGYRSAWMTWSDIASGAALFCLALASLSWRDPGPLTAAARWACAAVGTWLLVAPLVFWAPTAAAYANDTLCGMLAIGFAVLTRPAPGVGRVARMTGPDVPPGWSFNPSGWGQRMPIIVLALVGLYVSRYLAAYQLGHIDDVWEPFFAGGPDPKNGTEEIVTSSVSEAWPVSDAGVGAVTYALEILTGVIGSTARWRTMPWLVMLFGIMIVPLGAVSIAFIVIQPIVIGTWCTLCLIAAAAMLAQIPYSLDELVATTLFLRRRKRQGHALLRVFFRGDTDDEARGEGGGRSGERDDFAQGPVSFVVDMMGGGVTLPWSLAASLAIGVWLMLTRLTLGTGGGMADADHLIGSLVVTVTVVALAEVARPLRFLNMALGAALLVTPIAFGADVAATAASLACGTALIALAVPRGPVRNRYGGWSRLLA